jgi:starch-binding outer membrane protein, SusD/RagB family
MKKLLLILISVCVLISCEKGLDLQPYAELSETNALKDASSIESCISGIYLKASWAIYYDGYKSYGDFLGDCLQPVDVYNPNENYFRNENRNGTWALGWQCINAANLVIEAINKGNAGTGTNADRMKGEAFFWRATMQFELTRQFGPQFDESMLNEEAVMIYTSPVRDFKGGPLKPVNECYEQVTADLLAAAELLPTSYSDITFPYSYSTSKNRVLKDAAWAMLSRINFQKGTNEGYTDAIKYTNMVLGNTSGSISTNRQLASSVKSLFRLQGVGDQGTLPEILVQLSNTEYRGYNTGFPFSITANSLPTYMVNELYLTKTNAVLNAQYIINNTDSRVKDLYELKIDRVTKKPYFLIRKYDISTMGYINFPYLRSAELLLNRAESEWKLGNYNNAFADYKLLKSRSIPLASNEVLGTSENLLDSIQQERLRELILEGDRFWDLLRQREFIYGGSADVVEFNWNDPRAKCRIPNEEIIKNPYLEGY